MTLEQYTNFCISIGRIKAVNVVDSSAAKLRLGQIAFNRLYDLYPEIANDLRGTDADPFYVDSRLDKFFEEVAKHIQ